MHPGMGGRSRTDAPRWTKAPSTHGLPKVPIYGLLITFRSDLDDASLIPQHEDFQSHQIHTSNAIVTGNKHKMLSPPTTLTTSTVTSCLPSVTTSFSPTTCLPPTTGYAFSTAPKTADELLVWAVLVLVVHTAVCAFIIGCCVSPCRHKTWCVHCAASVPPKPCGETDAVNDAANMWSSELFKRQYFPADNARPQSSEARELKKKK